MVNSMHRYIATTIIAAVLCGAMLRCAGPARRDGAEYPRRYEFREVWGYLMKGEEHELTGREPFTDILYFGVSVDSEGKLFGSTTPPTLPFEGIKPRVHLVVFKLADPALLHSCLNKEGTVRENLIDDIAAAAENFDGIQIDFESLMPDDGEAFNSFLTDLKVRLPDKVLSAAVPARLNGAGNGKKAYDYAALAGIVDRVFVMAYDQHWETSQPGPVASLSWCGSVAGYAVSAILPDRLVMGIPLYGRAWQARKINRAVTHRRAVELARRRVDRRTGPADQGPFFEYVEKVTVKVFYEDTGSIHEKLRLYESYRIPAVAFWRIGQGPPELWGTIVIGGRE